MLNYSFVWHILISVWNKNVVFRISADIYLSVNGWLIPLQQVIPRSRHLLCKMWYCLNYPTLSISSLKISVKQPKKKMSKVPVFTVFLLFWHPCSWTECKNLLWYCPITGKYDSEKRQIPTYFVWCMTSYLMWYLSPVYVTDYCESIYRDYNLHQDIL